MAYIDVPWYCTREEVLDAMDFRESTLRTASVDSAIAGASRSVDDLCHRRFYPNDTTHKWDWPNFQRAYPWRIWLEEQELADTIVNVPIVTSGGNLIAAGNLKWGPWDGSSPPFNFLELSRSSSESFGRGDTPQQDVSITGTYGYWTKTEVRGSLAASINGTVTQLHCSDGSILSGLGVGDILLVGSERMLINGKLSVSSGDTVQSGCTTNSAADNVLGVTSGATYNVGEQVLIGAERMYIDDIAGNTCIVKRAWGGSKLSTHTAGDTIYVYRTLTVQRGELGTTAAAHSMNDVLYRYAIPGPVRELAVAESINGVQQKTSGYARTIGEGSGMRNASGSGLDDIRLRTYRGYGRKTRTGAI